MASLKNPKFWMLIRSIPLISKRGIFHVLGTSYPDTFYPFRDIRTFKEISHLTIESKGMTMQTLASKINNGSSAWNSNTSSRCNITDTNYWDTDSAADGDDIKNAVYSLNIEKITTNFEVPSAVCFSRNGKFYESAGALDNTTVGVLNFMYVCRRDFEGDVCNINYSIADNKAFRQPPPGGDQNEDYYRTINWTRFGNITTSKLNNEYDATGFSGGTWIDVPIN